LTVSMFRKPFVVVVTPPHAPTSYQRYLFLVVCSVYDMCFAPFSYLTCSNRWDCMKIIWNPWESMKIYANPWKLMEIHENIWNPLKYMGYICFENKRTVLFYILDFTLIDWWIYTYLLCPDLYFECLDLFVYFLCAFFWFPDPSKKTRTENTWILAVLRPPDLLPGPDWWPKRWMVCTPQMSILSSLIGLLAVPGQY
jgi:hypothetical protein